MQSMSELLVSPPHGICRDAALFLAPAEGAYDNMAMRPRQNRWAIEAAIGMTPSCAEAPSSAVPCNRRLHGRPLNIVHAREKELSGKVVPFPRHGRGRFTAEMRDVLSRFAREVLNRQSLAFGLDSEGSECCRLDNGLVIGWDQGRLILTDTLSGYVDRGPFSSLDEICLLIADFSA